MSKNKITNGVDSKGRPQQMKGESSADFNTRKNAWREKQENAAKTLTNESATPVAENSEAKPTVIVETKLAEKPAIPNSLKPPQDRIAKPTTPAIVDAIASEIVASATEPIPAGTITDDSEAKKQARIAVVEAMAQTEASKPTIEPGTAPTVETHSDDSKSAVEPVEAIASVDPVAAVNETATEPVKVEASAAVETPSEPAKIEASAESTEVAEPAKTEESTPIVEPETVVTETTPNNESTVTNETPAIVETTPSVEPSTVAEPAKTEASASTSEPATVEPVAENKTESAEIPEPVKVEAQAETKNDSETDSKEFRAFVGKLFDESYKDTTESKLQSAIGFVHASNKELRIPLALKDTNGLPSRLDDCRNISDISDKTHRYRMAMFAYCVGKLARYKGGESDNAFLLRALISLKAQSEDTRLEFGMQLSDYKIGKWNDIAADCVGFLEVDVDLLIKLAETMIAVNTLMVKPETVKTDDSKPKSKNEAKRQLTDAELIALADKNQRKNGATPKQTSQTVVKSNGESTTTQFDSSKPNESNTPSAQALADAKAKAESINGNSGL